MMSDRSLPKFDDDEDDESEDLQIQWSDLIFLPFHPVFKMMVLLSVIVKTTLGPIQSIYSIVHCSDVMDRSIYLFFIKYFYSYICEVIYFVDTFLHIVHRQVTDKAMRREHLPKSGFLLILDVISLIPFYSLTSYELCPPVQLWPNILAFSEFVVIYRVVEYFSLVTTHSYLRLLLGFTIVLVISVNCVGCFLLLLTENGLCSNCRNGIFDWRKYVLHKLNETDTRFTTYVYGTSFVFSFAVNTAFDQIKPSTILEYFLVSFFMLIGYLLDIYVVMPKIFAESILGLRRICTFHPHVRRIIEETKRRNPCPTAYINVSNFYSLMWKKRKGITTIPQIIGELPRYLRIDIRQDLVWPVFHHSPTLRNTSTPFKRWLCEFIYLDYKLPGEKLYAGPHCHTNLYYLKTGIVELISADDGVTALLSLSGGTIFGDVSFMVPPLKRNLIVRCITYCEVFMLPRYDILKAMQKYPTDRRHILASVKERIKHARTLNTCKQHVRGLDRTEDEGLAWLKRRWWEISEAVANWKKNPKNDKAKFELPPEEAAYHCAKYIGQLVLCSGLQLRKKSQFANVRFPWILMPNSTFIKVWKKIVMFTVILALIMYPPNITKKKVRNWFRFIQLWTDFVYFSDLTISLMTSPRKHAVIDNFSSVMFARFKSPEFVLDILSTMWIELLTLLAGKPEYYYMLQFNRLLKVYILFSSDYLSEWSINRQPFFSVCYKVLLTNFCYVYIIAYAIHVLMRYLPGLTPSYFFGERYRVAMKTLSSMCGFEEQFLGVAIAYTYELLFFEFPPHRLVDIYVAAFIAFLGFLTYMMTKCRFVAYLYLKYREITSYQAFVSNLKKYYTHHKIHHDLMKRLDRYLMCQWKYYHGADIMHPNLLKNEPFDIYWKVHGEVAEKIIRESKAFAGADPTMIKELAYAANFLIVPKNATLFLFGVECRNVTWIVQGHIKCEYHNEEGELLKSYYDPGEMVSVSAVLLRKPSIRTYSSCTECEIIFIKIQDFFNIIKHYPQEWSYFQNCIEECEPVFEEMFEAYVKKHRDYQKKLRDRIFHARQSVVSARRPNEPEDVLLLSPIDLHNWVDPDSDFMYYWMIFRAITVLVSITTASLQGGSGAVIRWPLTLIGALCDCIAWIDIILKLFMSHYNEKGILIYDYRMCATHYLTRGFLLDIVGAVPWFELFRMILTQPIDGGQAMLMNTFCKFAHIYILMEFFNHLADMPSINSSYILILKWQTMLVLVMLGGSHYLMNHCIKLKFDDQSQLNGIQRLNNCWIPAYMVLDEKPSIYQLHLLFAQSFNLAQSGLMRMNLGKFIIDRRNLGVGIILLILGVIFWYVTCYSLTMMVLSTRYNTLFQHHVSQLKKFLTAERVDQKLIDEAGAHFGYWWMRNKGINIHQLMNERLGVVFRQDLSYYFFKTTFMALDKLLGGGEQLQRQLSSMGYQIYLRPNQEVIREMDLTSYVYIVHRGKVIVTKEGTKLAELTKGSIFGQLEGTTPRPARVSVVSDSYVDLLQINIAQFQDTINDEVRENIAENLQSQDDYMAVKKPIQENPHNTIEYILRGHKAIKLPWMKNPVEARRNTWYSKWLFVAWMISPFVTIVLVLLLAFVPHHTEPDLLQDIYWGLTAMDVIFLAHVISEFYTLDLVVVNDVLVKERLGYRNLMNWGFYVDVVSMALPFITLIRANWGYQLARLLRLRLFYEFYQHFCTSFKSRVAPILMNSCIVFLLLHAMVCGWIFVACRNDDPFPVPILKVPEKYMKTIDRGEWVVPGERVGGCSRMTMNFKLNETVNRGRTSFLVPRHWYNDYMVALLFIVLLHTHTVLDTVVALSIKEVYYKVLITACIFLLDMWLISAAISAVYTKFRELYQYDYSVSNLTTYLHHSGLSPTLLDSVRRYTRQLWQRQRGNWLPELANQAPPCLREDLLSALYMHHLRLPGLFKNLPPYFTRQLVARFQRVVIFPGKCIVQEGDIFPCIYFIHEGEVEKWYTDASGENKLMSLLTTNGYFGLIPGLFPNVPFQFSYYTRTVVDLVYLKLKFWQDLLTAYPEIRNELYDSAKHMKKELLRKHK